jgi:AP-4 complex subunit sigma-1
MHKVVFRRYASLYFIVGIDDEENELATSEIIHFMVETMDRYFGTVCELDIMFNFDKVHLLIDEVIANGCIVEGSRRNALGPLELLDQHSGKEYQ